MTPSRRIFLNVAATYGRSVYALVLGVFTSRWVFHALGEVDYGLWGLVGGLVGFVTFLNGVLAGAVVRFYAISVGISNDSNKIRYGLDECQRWFNCALTVHTIIPVFLLIIGYPCGVWAIENFLTIPAERIEACILVWRYTSVACLAGMLGVPFQAMYTAKQEIAELTIYGVASSTVSALFIYYMVSHPGDWLIKYAAFMCCCHVIPQLIIAMRAFLIYPECRLVRGYLVDLSRFKMLAKFVFAKFWSRFSDMCSQQAQAVLVNKYMGIVYNSSMAMGNMIAGQATTLSSSISGAFAPAIINKIGASDHGGMFQLSLSTCRLGSAMVILFAVPISLEIDEIFRIWLVNPPPFAEKICLLILFRALLEHMSDGYATAIYGSGEGALSYSWLVGWVGLLMVALMWILFAMGFGMWSIIIGLLISKLLLVVIRVVLAQRFVEFPIKRWLKEVLCPVFAVASVTMIIGLIPRCLMEPSLVRVLLTGFASLIAFVIMVWEVLLVSSEKERIKKILCRSAIE